MRATLLTVCLIVLFNVVGCDLPNASDDNPIADQNPNEAAVAIDILPAFSGSIRNPRSVIPAGSTAAQVLYSLFTPPLTRFTAAPTSFKVGDSLEVTILGNAVTLSTSIRDGNIVFAGTIIETASDDSQVETGKVELIYKKETSRFSFHSELLIADPENVLDNGSDFYAYTVVDIPETTINDDYSFLASASTLAMLMPGTINEFQYLDAIEIYSGIGNTGDPVVGFASGAFTSSLVSDHAALDGADFASMVSAEGIPLPTAVFQPIKDAIIAARSVLAAAIEDNGAHMLGYRIIESPVTSTYVYNAPEYATDGVYLVDADGNRLKNSSGEDIEFARDAPDATMESKVVSNVVKLVSGFPTQAWREASRLPGVYATRSTYVDDR